MANPFVHMELNTDNPGKAMEFYKSLFSWTFEEMDMGGGMKYTGIKTGEGPGGGLQKKPMPEAPTAWTVYVQVDSVAATLDKVQSLGGTVVVPKTAIPEMGAFGIIMDPTGAFLGVWESATK